DPHRVGDRVLPHELLVNLEHALELVVDHFPGVRPAPAFVELGDVEVDLLAAPDPLAHPANAVDDETDDVAGEEIAVLRVHLLADVPAIRLWDIRRRTGIHRISGRPYPPPL